MKNLILILISVLLFSCGTRKTSKSQTEIKTEASTTIEASTVAASETEKQTETETKTDIAVKNDIIDEAEKLEPIDPDKPIIKTTETKDGKTISTWQNAKVDISKKADKSEKSTTGDIKEKTAEKTKKDLTEKVKVKEDEKVDIEIDTKDTTKTPMSNWWYLLLLIPIVAAYVWYNTKSKD
jgi:hypothetical protein